jgi:hypothetical protein
VWVSIWRFPTLLRSCTTRQASRTNVLPTLNEDDVRDFPASAILKAELMLYQVHFGLQGAPKPEQTR